MKLTTARIEALEGPNKGRKSYADDAAPGLSITVTAAGTKSFIFQKRVNGHPAKVTIGRWPAVSLATARTEAAKLAGEVAQGKNPAAERRAVRDETTFGELFTLYLDGHAKLHKRTWQEDEKQYNRHLTPWAGRKLSSITRGTVAKLHAKVGKTAPYSANRLLALVSKIFSFARSMGLQADNPAQGIKRFREQSRDRFLNADELRRFFDALALEVDPWPDLFTLALLTGARRSNVLAMKWADLELTRGLWKIHADESKNAEPLIVVLHAAAVDILERRRGDLPEDAAYVFPSHGEAGHVVETKSAWSRITKRADLAGVRLHDLRRTLGSWQAANGASLSVIGRSLGHKNHATTAVYARLDMDPIKRSVTTAVDAMLAAAKAAQDAPQATIGHGDDWTDADAGSILRSCTVDELDRLDLVEVMSDAGVPCLLSRHDVEAIRRAGGGEIVFEIPAEGKGLKRG